MRLRAEASLFFLLPPSGQRLRGLRLVLLSCTRVPQCLPSSAELLLRRLLWGHHTTSLFRLRRLSRVPSRPPLRQIRAVALAVRFSGASELRVPATAGWRFARLRLRAASSTAGAVQRLASATSGATSVAKRDSWRAATRVVGPIITCQPCWGPSELGAFEVVCAPKRRPSPTASAITLTSNSGARPPLAGRRRRACRAGCSRISVRASPGRLRRARCPRPT